MNAALLTPDDVTTTLTGGPLGGMVPVGDHSFIAANGSANALVWNAATGQVVGRSALALGGSPSAITGSGNAFVASDVAGTMTWVSFGPASSAALATPAGAIPAGSRFGISAAPDLLLTGVGDEFTVWSTDKQRPVRSFTRVACRSGDADLLRPRPHRLAGSRSGTTTARSRCATPTPATSLSRSVHLVTGTAQVSFAGDALVVSTYPTAEPAELVVVAPDGAVRRLWRAPEHRRINAFATSGESVAVGLDNGQLLLWDHRRARPTPRPRPRCCPRLADRVQCIRAAPGGG